MRAVRYVSVAVLLFATVSMLNAQDEDDDNNATGNGTGNGNGPPESDTVEVRVLSHYWGKGHVQNDGMHKGKLNDELVANLAKIVAAGDLSVILGIREDPGDATPIPHTAQVVADKVQLDLGVEYAVTASPQSGASGAEGRGPQYECKFPEQIVFFRNTDKLTELGHHSHVDGDSFYINPDHVAVEVILGHNANQLATAEDLFQFNVGGYRFDPDPNRDNGYSPNRVAHELSEMHKAYNQAQDSLGKRPMLSTGTLFADCGTNQGGDDAFNGIELFNLDGNTVLTEGSTYRPDSCRYDVHIGTSEFADGVTEGFVSNEVVPIVGLGIEAGKANQISPHEAVVTTITYQQKAFGPPSGSLLLVLLAASAVAGAILGGAYYARQKAVENDELLYGGMSSKGSMSYNGSAKGGFAAGVARPQTAVSGVSSYTRGGAMGVADGDRMSGMTGLTRGDALGMGGRSSRGSRSSKSSKSSRSKHSKGSRSSRGSKSHKSRGSRSGSHGSKSHKSRGSRSGSAGNKARMTGVTGFTRGGFDGVSDGTRGTNGSGTSHATHKTRSSAGSKGSKGSHASRKSRSSSGSKATHASKATRSSSGSGR